MTNDLDYCPIWGHGFSAKGYPIPKRAMVVVEDSPRAGGGYEIGQQALAAVRELDCPEKARLTSLLVEQRMLGDERPGVTWEMVEDARSRRPLLVPERALRLLRYLVEMSEDIGQQFVMGKRDSVEWGALAWSESEAWFRAIHFAKYLESKGWISLEERYDESTIVVLVDGYSRLADQPANTDLSQAFVAMWFDDETKVLYEKGIEPAVKQAGYEPKRIDKDPSVDKSDDAIVAEIRRSRFLVADFTYGKEGARGGVYYEVGLAHGLNLPVIFTCHRRLMKDIHFDTRQYFHIQWDENRIAEFRDELCTRILARLGPGPKVIAN